MTGTSNGFRVANKHRPPILIVGLIQNVWGLEFAYLAVLFPFSLCLISDTKKGANPLGPVTGSGPSAAVRTAFPAGECEGASI